MSNKNGNSLPGRPSVKADSDTQRELLRRTPLVSGRGISIIHTPSGSILEQRRERAQRYLLPFQVTVTPTSLKAAAGVLDGQTINQTVESSLVVGTWYFRAKLTINDTTGARTAWEAIWTQTEDADTSTVYYSTLAEVEVVSVAGTLTPDRASIIQYNYGPLLVLMAGAVDAKWQAIII